VSAASTVGPSRIVLLICYLGFVSLGLPDTVIGVAWPSVRETFGVRQSAVSWIFVGAGCSYFISSFLAGRLLTLFNVGFLLAASSALVSLSGFNFAAAPAWAWFAAGAWLHGLGSGAIDAGLNHYVASHFSARHMNWLHACYSAGAMLGPVIMTAAITRADSWRLGYLIVAITLLALSILFLSTRGHWGVPRAASAEIGVAVKATTAAIALRSGMVWLHMTLFFVYTGLEVALGQWSFTVLIESRHAAPATAGVWVSIYWAAILVGRILFGFVVERIGIDTLVRCSLVTAAAGTALFLWDPRPWTSPLALALAGFGLAAIYPSLMTRTPQRMGAGIAAHAVGFQVGAAMLGAAALPSVVGFVAERAGLNVVPAVVFGVAAGLWLLHELTVWLTRPTRVAARQ
jgi:fucose permease